MNEVERIRKICEEMCPNETCSKVNCFECREFAEIEVYLACLELSNHLAEILKDLSDAINGYKWF